MIISNSLGDNGKQKYRNVCPHCSHFERNTQGNHQENKKQQNKIQDAAIITSGYPELSHGIYQWPPCLGFDPQLLLKSQKNRAQN